MIGAENYDMCPIWTAKEEAKNIPDSYETQRKYTKKSKQGVRRTKVKVEGKDRGKPIK